MRLPRRLLPLALLFLAETGRAREFSVVVHNVENLFDADGISLFEDYRPPLYTPAHLATKLENLGATLRRFDEGAGPDILILNELEADQTPDSTVADVAGFIDRWRGRTVRDLLTAAELEPELAGAPAHAWLAKRLVDEGFAPYELAVAEWRPDPTGQVVAHVNAVFTRFPIVAVRNHHTDGARAILEVEVSVEGRRLHVFANHWKSGASDPAAELVRIGNASVLRDRLAAILRKDPLADVILGGDFNSQYNQRQVNPSFRRTALDDVLGSQGDEAAVRDPRGPALYNLWFELPVERRGSDVFRDEWGTLMQILVTRGLYDERGIQYVDGSFAVGAFPGFNAEVATGRPRRWRFAGGGGGYSDHFPLVARFRVVEVDRPGRWMPLENPSRTRVGPATPVPVRFDLSGARPLTDFANPGALLRPGHIGALFRVSGRVVGTRPFRVLAEGPAVDLPLWIPNQREREAFFARYAEGDRIEFVAELGQYRGDWQWVVLVPR